MSLEGKTLFITGASRGIGLATAIKAAKDGANIVIASKTTKPHPKLPGTIYTAAKAIEKAGGQCLPIPTDIRYEDQIQAAIEQTVEQFSGLDVLINNASAISPSQVISTESKRYDLMHQINGRGSFLCAKYSIPHLEKSDNPHIVFDCPPLSTDLKSPGMFSLHPKILSGKMAYIASKYLMTFWTLGMAEELKSKGIAVNSIWPVTPIDTAAVRNLLKGMISHARKPEIMADATYHIITKKSSEFTGHCLLDEPFLREEGVTDFSVYEQ